MRSGNSPQLACWSILAFGFQFYNHRHHSRWEDYDLVKTKKKGPRNARGASKRVRSSDPCVISTVLCLLSYTCIWVLCRKAPEREFVFVHSEDTRIKTHRAYLVNLYTAPSVRLALHSASLNFIMPIRIYEINADLRHTNCLIFAHVRPVRRHGLSIE